MSRLLDPLQFVLIALSGWMNCRQSQVINYLREENRVLREQLGAKRLRFTDDQRRRLAAKSKGLGRTVLRELSTIVTPETLLAWHHRVLVGADRSVRYRPENVKELEGCLFVHVTGSCNKLPRTAFAFSDSTEYRT